MEHESRTRKVSHGGLYGGPCREPCLLSLRTAYEGPVIAWEAGLNILQQIYGSSGKVGYPRDAIDKLGFYIGLLAGGQNCPLLIL